MCKILINHASLPHLPKTRKKKPECFFIKNTPKKKIVENN